MDNEKFWYVFYTHPRSEKVVSRDLLEKGYETFLPVIKDLHCWKNRQKKWIDVVLFPSYIFVRICHSELYHIKKIPKIVTHIHCGGVPSLIRDREIEAIKKMIGADKEVAVETNFAEGEKIRITKGALMGHEGILIKRNGKDRFAIQLKEINHTVSIITSPDSFEKIC